MSSRWALIQSGSKCVVLKISGSGSKVMVVPWPRKGPIFSIGPAALPRLKVCSHSKPSRLMLAHQLFRERIDHRRADAMQAARVHVIAPFAELGARVQRRQDQLQCRLLVLGMQIDGNAPAIIDHGDRVAGLVQRDGDAVGEAIEILIDRIIDDFPDEVMQALLVRVADIHRRPLADRFEPFENGNIFRGVTRTGHRFLSWKIVKEPRTQ